MTKPIGPGVNVVCTKTVTCPCGCATASHGAIYMCEGIGPGGFLHRMFCPTEGCDGTLVQLVDKVHCLCACCFAPLDDGDTSLVADEEEDPMVLTPAERIDA